MLINKTEFSPFCVKIVILNKNSRFRMNEVNNCIFMSIVDSFPQLIVHGPDVRIMACDFDLYIEARKSIQRAKFGVMFVYDTAFNLTGLYASFLTFVPKGLHPFLVTLLEVFYSLPLF